MLEDAVGESVIRKGLSRYLQEHKFGNAVTDDLWEAIAAEWHEQQKDIEKRDPR